MSTEETKREMEIATVEVNQMKSIQDEATELQSQKQRPLIDFGKSVGAAASAAMFEAFANVVKIQSLKAARDNFEAAKSRAVGALIDGCSSWSAYCAHHGIHTSDAKMRITLLEELGESFIRHASIIGLARKDYRALMALPTDEQSALVQTITEIEIYSVEQAREVKEQFRGALEIFQEKLAEKDELLRIKAETNETLAHQLDKLAHEKEKRQELEEQVRKVEAENTLYKTGDRPSHNIEQITKELAEAKNRFTSALTITRGLKPDNHESLSAIRMLYSWLEDEIRFAVNLTEKYAGELDQE